MRDLGGMMFRNVRLLVTASWFAFSLTVAAGCGGKSSSTAVEAGGAQGEPQCDDFANEPDQLLSVVIANKTQQTIYIGPQQHGCSTPDFQVTDSEGAPISAQSSCHTCQDFRQSATTPCYPILCPVGSVTTLQPGETMGEQWNALYVVDKTLPATCAFNGESTSCQQRLRIQPAPFIFSAQAGTAIDCSQFSGSTCPVCTPNGAGGCYIGGALISGTLLSASTKVLLDESYGVGDLASRCAGNTCIVRSVEIDFTDW